MITIQERVTKAMHQLALIGAAARGAADDANVLPREVLAGITHAAEEAHMELYWVSQNSGNALETSAPTDDDIESTER